MLNLENVLTKRSKTLLDEVKSLDPTKKIVIQEFTDKDFQKKTAGAAVITNDVGESIIYLDPSRVTEHGFIHELMHIKLHRSGWSQVYPMIPDKFVDNLALRIDNLMDHYLFNPKIEEMEIDTTKYKSEYCSIFDDWTRHKSKKLDVLWNSFLICEGLLFEEPYRTKTVKSMEKKYSESLDLAFRLEQIISSTKINKKDARKTAMRLVDYINKWIQIENPEVPNLRRIIGISPLFTKNNLSKKAPKYLDFKFEEMTINHYERCITTFILKSDKTRFKTYVSKNKKETPEMISIKRSWRKKKLKTLLNSKNLMYGTI